MCVCIIKRICIVIFLLFLSLLLHGSCRDVIRDFGIDVCFNVEVFWIVESVNLLLQGWHI